MAVNSATLPLIHILSYLAAYLSNYCQPNYLITNLLFFLFISWWIHSSCASYLSEPLKAISTYTSRTVALCECWWIVINYLQIHSFFIARKLLRARTRTHVHTPTHTHTHPPPPPTHTRARAHTHTHTHTQTTHKTNQVQKTLHLCVPFALEKGFLFPLRNLNYIQHFFNCLLMGIGLV